MCNFQAAARFERCFRSSEQGNNTLGIHPVSTLYTAPGMSIWHLFSHAVFIAIKPQVSSVLFLCAAMQKTGRSKIRSAGSQKLFSKIFFSFCAI